MRELGECDKSLGKEKKMSIQLKVLAKNDKSQKFTKIWNSDNFSENTYRKNEIDEDNKNLNNVSKNSTEADYSFYIIIRGLNGFNNDICHDNIEFNVLICFNNHSFYHDYFSLDVLGKFSKYASFSLNIFNRLYTDLSIITFYTFSINPNFHNFSLVEKFTNFHYLIFEENNFYNLNNIYSYFMNFNYINFHILNFNNINFYYINFIYINFYILNFNNNNFYYIHFNNINFHMRSYFLAMLDPLNLSFKVHGEKYCPFSVIKTFVKKIFKYNNYLNICFMLG